MDRMPDTVLTLAAVAAAAHGPTHVSNIGNFQVKECDRISAAATELHRLGVPAHEGNDSITIFPAGSVAPARIETYNDHRVAMSFALLGLRTPGIEIANPDCVAKSFPTFWAEFERFRQHHQSSNRSRKLSPCGHANRRCPMKAPSHPRWRRPRRAARRILCRQH